LRSEVSEANETKQATHQPLTAICDVTGIIFYFSMRFSIIHLNLKLYFRF
jgi:hypothetical protein